MESLDLEQFVREMESQFVPFDVDELLHQIGPLYSAMISGGRIVKRATGITFLVNDECNVTVDLNGMDIYTVRRVHVQNGEQTIQGEMKNVYWDEVARISYRASCFNSFPACNNEMITDVEP